MKLCLLIGASLLKWVLLKKGVKAKTMRVCGCMSRCMQRATSMIEKPEGSMIRGYERGKSSA